MGTLLSSHMVLTHRLSPRDVRKIILELQPLSKKLLQDYVSALQIFLSHFFKMHPIVPKRSLLFIDTAVDMLGHDGVLMRVGFRGRDETGQPKTQPFLSCCRNGGSRLVRPQGIWLPVIFSEFSCLWLIPRGGTSCPPIQEPTNEWQMPA